MCLSIRFLIICVYFACAIYLFSLMAACAAEHLVNNLALWHNRKTNQFFGQMNCKTAGPKRTLRFWLIVLNNMNQLKVFIPDL